MTSSPMEARLGRERRIRRRPDFLAIQGRPGARVRSRSFLALLVRSVDGSPPRVGVVASRKIGGAVRRNRCKRLLKEMWRRNRSVFEGADVVFVAQAGLADLGYAELEAELDRVKPEIARRLKALAGAPGRAQAGSGGPPR